MYELMTFDAPNELCGVRVIMDDEGNPWFVAADVCRVLDLDLSGSTYNHLKKLREDEVKTFKKSSLTFSNGNLNDASFPNRGANCVSESGLYTLIMRSEKPSAKKFQDWVCRVVLPTIRKDGAYILGEEKVVSGEMSEDEFIAKAVLIASKKVERLKAEKSGAAPSARVFAGPGALE